MLCGALKAKSSYSLIIKRNGQRFREFSDSSKAIYNDAVAKLGLPSSSLTLTLIFFPYGILHQYQTLLSSHHQFSFSCKLYWRNIMIQFKSVHCVPTRVAFQKVRWAGTKLTKDLVPILVRERYSQMTISPSLVTSKKSCHGNSQLWEVMELRESYSRLKDLSVFWELCGIWE